VEPAVTAHVWHDDELCIIWLKWLKDAELIPENLHHQAARNGIVRECSEHLPHEPGTVECKQIISVQMRENVMEAVCGKLLKRQ
jgi:hypothetical protein